MLKRVDHAIDCAEERSSPRSSAPSGAPLAAAAIDLKTAQALGLAIPPLALALANLVIE